MYCPKCGQLQKSDDIRYCSACGSSLGGVAEAMRGGETLSAADVKRSAWIGFGLVTLSAVFLLTTLILGTPEPSFLVQMNLLVAILVYLSALGYVFFKFRSPSHPGQNQLARPDSIERAATTRNLLKEQDLIDFVSAEPAGPHPEHAVMSVTEDTTRFLKDEPPANR